MNQGTLLFVNFAVYAWLLLIPIMAVKAWEIRKTLPLSTGRVIATSGLANLGSTMLTTLGAFAVGWVAGHNGFEARPTGGEGDLAVLLALVPCFFMSVWADTLVGSGLNGNVPRKAIRAAFLRANLLGYSMIGIVPVVRFAKSAIWNGRFIW